MSQYNKLSYSICKISNIACGPPFWTVLDSWYPHHEVVVIVLYSVAYCHMFAK